MTQLILIRHGQSQWNLENRFTGWWDVDVTEKGIAEAKAAGILMKEKGIAPAIGFTSVQTRAIKTMNLALQEMDMLWLPVTKNWQLNERHYGGLTGLNKQETRDKHGDEQVHIWRRSFDVPPPQITPDHEYHPANDPRYAGFAADDLPGGESLKLTLDRVLPYFNADIAPHIKAGKTLLISAHGNSLRALLKELFKVSDDDIPGYEFPTGNPLLIDLTDGTLDVTAAKYLDESRAKPLPPF